MKINIRLSLKKISSCTLLGIFFSMQALAVDYNLRFTGMIADETCDISVQSQDQSVNIGDFNVNDFKSIGDATPVKAFNINLINCSANVVGATTTFSGNADTINSDLLAISEGSNSGEKATGVAIEILDNSFVPIPINSETKSYPISSGNNTLSFLLRYKATSIPTTAGSANSVLYFDVNYL